MTEGIPLCVDMDGTLIKTDSLFESILLLLKKQIFMIALLPVWLFKGKAELKVQVAARTTPRPELYPYNQEFLAYLNQQAATNRRIILVTAANKLLAEDVANHLGIFDDVIATDNKNNLTGMAKLEKIIKHCDNQPFDYAGNAMVDLDIWEHAQAVIIVNPDRGVEKAAGDLKQGVVVFDKHTMNLSTLIKGVRIHQWLKNLLVFVPLLAPHNWHHEQSVLMAAFAFLSFSLCASSVYLLNDLLDLSNDRLHPIKKNRPIASGTLSIKLAVFLIPVLIALSFMLAGEINNQFSYVLSWYLIITTSYSFWLKRIVFVDVLVLAGLYTLRIVAGAAAINVEASIWLLAFSMFLFLSLAMVKRFSELLDLHNRGQFSTQGRGYQVTDMETLASIGVTSGFLAVFVLALYINSKGLLNLYTNPSIIWLLCPVLLYWISRVWSVARRGNMHEDPILFAIVDRQSQIMGIVIAVLLLVAI